MNNIASLIFYSLSFILSGGLLGLRNDKNSAVGKISRGLSIMIPTMIAACRFQVGTDYKNYDYFFNYIRVHSIKECVITVKWEIGFLFIVKCLTIVKDNRFIFGILTFLTLCIVLTALEYFDNLNKKIAYITYLFFFFGGTLNIVRQSLACAVILIAYQYVFRNEKYKFALLVIIATSVHVSALIALPVYLLWNHDKKDLISYKKMLLIYFGFGFSVFMWRSILKILLSSGMFFLQKFRYLFRNNNGMNRDIYVKLAILLVVFVFYKELEKLNKVNKLFICLYIFNIIISFTGYQITFFKRTALYFEIPIIVLIGQLECFFKQGKSRYLANFIIVFMAWLYFFLDAYLLKHAEIIPYRWR